MINLLVLIAVLLCSCSTIKYTDGESSFERTSYFTFTSINEMTIKIVDSKGRARELNLSGTSDQVQALEKVAEGIAKGMVEGAKP